MYYFADLEQQIISLSVKTALIGSAILLFGALIAVMLEKRAPKKQYDKLKLPIFVIMMAATIIPTLILSFNTVYINVVSESNGPVHWHADIEFWACDNEVELRDPTGFLSNKIGTSTYHEHNDKRIHLEGVVIDKRVDASLGKFMEVTGGYINDESVAIPINENPGEWLTAGEKIDGDEQSMDFLPTMDNYVGLGNDGHHLLQLNNGSMACGLDQSEVQVFVYSFDDETDTYSQTKISDPADYVIAEESIVPPGDCIIVEFGAVKEETDKLCRQYGVRDSERCTEFGVASYDPELCNVRYVGLEVN